jgi:hypothetical protein
LSFPQLRIDQLISGGDRQRSFLYVGPRTQRCCFFGEIGIAWLGLVHANQEQFVVLRLHGYARALGLDNLLPLRVEC